MDIVRILLLAAVAVMPLTAACESDTVSCSASSTPLVAEAPISATIHQDSTCLIDAAAGFPSDARIVDVRSRPDYARLHIPGAINQPLHSLLNAGAGPVIVYDGSRFRPDALQLCERLKRYGVRDFRVVDGGIAAWAQSRSPGDALDVSRLSDGEVSAAIMAGTSTIVPLHDGFPSVLRTLGVELGAANAGTTGSTILLASPGTGHERIASRLRRRTGQSPVLHWTGTPDQLAGILEVRQAQNQRLRQGPMVDTRCPGL